MPHHPKRRGTTKFSWLSKQGIKKLILKKGVEKVNKFENRGIKIAFKHLFHFIFNFLDYIKWQKLPINLNTKNIIVHILNYFNFYILIIFYKKDRIWVGLTQSIWPSPKNQTWLGMIGFFYTNTNIIYITGVGNQTSSIGNCIAYKLKPKLQKFVLNLGHFFTQPCGSVYDFYFNNRTKLDWIVTKETRSQSNPIFNTICFLFWFFKKKKLILV